MTLHKIFAKLRKQNQGQYLMLGFCICLSVLLVTAFALMYLGPTVQEFLPIGGDTRKMANLLLAVTIVGCIIFTVYASGLFFRYKSREYGVLLALGTPKKALKPLLFRELVMLTGVSSVIGLVLAVPMSFGIWKIFDSILLSTDEMQYRFGAKGFIVGILFCAVLAAILFFYGMRFVKRTDIMDILKEGQKTETVKPIPSWMGKTGLVLIVVGILLGIGVPSITANFFHINIPAVFNLIYLISLAGIYMFMLSLVAQSSAGRHKEKYYKNLVSISLMRFSAKATTKNMCVAVLLLFSCLFAAFFGMLYATQTQSLDQKDQKAFLLHFPVEEKQVTKEDIHDLADEYKMTVTGYQENEACNLVISYNRRDMTDDGKYIEVDDKQAKLALFFSESIFKQLSGQEVSIENGTYKTVTPVNYKETIWDHMDGLYAVTNPDADKTYELAYDGSVEFTALSRISDPYAYILSDKDYQTITTALGNQYREEIIGFDVEDLQNSYAFAKALQMDYLQHTSPLSDHMGNYDAWEDKRAMEKGEDYSYGGSIGLSPDLKEVPLDWKYAPQFIAVEYQEYMQNVAVYVMLCLYIFIIMLTSVSIMSYVRGISVASENEGLFLSLQKLGANPAYRSKILKQQLKKIFQYPAVIGCGAAFIFSLCLCWFNDMRFTSEEVQCLGKVFLLGFLVCAVLYVVYVQTYRKARKMLGMQ